MNDVNTIKYFGTVSLHNIESIEIKSYNKNANSISCKIKRKGKKDAEDTLYLMSITDIYKETSRIIRDLPEKNKLNIKHIGILELVVIEDDKYTYKYLLQCSSVEEFGKYMMIV